MKKLFFHKFWKVIWHQKENGELNYKWHDEDTIYTVDSENPLLIEPERLHHIILTGNVEFKVEFYNYSYNRNLSCKYFSSKFC